MVDRSIQGSSVEIRRALNQTVELDNGKRGHVFSDLSKGGRPSWMCHVCKKKVDSERAMSIHLSHPLHNSKLLQRHVASGFPRQDGQRVIDVNDSKPGFDDFKLEGQNLPSDDDGDGGEMEVATDVLPGEPVPPGMEDLVEGRCQIQDSLDAHKDSPLIGIEYIVELVSAEEEIEPRYICLMCEKKGDPRSVMVHLTSPNHYLKYISCFFRTAGNILNLMPKTPETRRGVNTAIVKVAEAIEKHFGRLKPTSAIMETFMTKKFEILRQIDEKQHFRETPETTFTDLITPDKIKEYNEYIFGGRPKPNPILREEEMAIMHENISKKKAEKKEFLQKKLSFTIGKGERSTGERKKPVGPTKVEDNKPKDNKELETIEVTSLSSVSSKSSVSPSSDDDERRRRRRGWRRSRSRSPGRGRRYRSRSRSRSRDRWRRRSPSGRRRHGSPYGRYRRSRSRSMERYSRSKFDYRFEDPRRIIDERIPRARLPSPPPSYNPKDREERERKLQWESFREDLQKLEKDMADQLRFYQDRPEKHPQYSTEWKLFWNRRYKEIQASGQDASKYDFKPEWILFWDKRMKELHEQELTGKKEELKRKHGLDELSKDRVGHELQAVSPPTPEEAKDVTVDDVCYTWKALTGTEISGPPKPVRRSPSPWEAKPTVSAAPPQKPPGEIPVNLNPVGKPVPEQSQNCLYEIVPPIVHCLRMLAVLEDQLGSHASKVIDLLSQSLALEKSRTNASMALLKNKDVYLFFEIVKEKLRGQLMAGIVLRQLVAPTRAVIKAIDNMLKANPLKPEEFEPVKIPGVGMVDKVAVSQKIASALIALGKTDVSQSELEELINAVVGMASASNTSAAATVSSDKFFSQLNLTNSNASDRINGILNSMIASAQQSLGMKIFTGYNTQPVSAPLQPLKIPLSTMSPVSVGSATQNTPPVKCELSPNTSDDILIDKLKKFTELPREDQQRLIELLKELEATQPRRVEKLKKFVGDTLLVAVKSKQRSDSSAKSDEGRRGANSEDDDEDYSLEEVLQSASEKVKVPTPVKEDPPAPSIPAEPLFSSQSLMSSVESVAANIDFNALLKVVGTVATSSQNMSGTSSGSLNTIAPTPQNPMWDSRQNNGRDPEPSAQLEPPPLFGGPDSAGGYSSKDDWFPGVPPRGGPQGGNFNEPFRRHDEPLQFNPRFSSNRGPRYPQTGPPPQENFFDESFLSQQQQQNQQQQQQQQQQHYFKAKYSGKPSFYNPAQNRELDFDLEDNQSGGSGLNQHNQQPQQPGGPPNFHQPPGQFQSGPRQQPPQQWSRFPHPGYGSYPSQSRF